MGRLFLVRHAQARFLSDNYDQLSALGETQARLLGEYWARRKMVFDRVCCGPAMRHRRTADLVGKAYKESAMKFPAPVVAHELDEFKGEAVMAESLAQLLPRSAEIRELHESFVQACSEGEKRARFQRLFEVVVSMWAREEITLRTVESWRDFCERVNRGLFVFLASAKKGRSLGHLHVGRASQRSRSARLTTFYNGNAARRMDVAKLFVQRISFFRRPDDSEHVQFVSAPGRRCAADVQMTK